MALEIFVPNTGQGDCTFIKFPNGKNMLIDINKTDVDVDINVNVDIVGYAPLSLEEIRDALGSRY